MSCYELKLCQVRELMSTMRRTRARLAAFHEISLTRSAKTGNFYDRITGDLEKIVTGSISMIETIKSIILDFQESKLETGVPRRLRIETAQRKAIVCIGVRRSGKSTYMSQVIQRLLDVGVPRQNVLYLNFFDDRLHNLRQDNLGLILEAYYSIYPGKKTPRRFTAFSTRFRPFKDGNPSLSA